MRPFTCGSCGQLVFFDNSACLGCGSGLGYLADHRRLVALEIDGALLRPIGCEGPPVRRCANELVAGCNWLVPSDPGGLDPGLCLSCGLTSVRPADDDAPAMAAFAKAEAAKRRLIDQLNGLGLPIVDRSVDPENGLTFELLSSRHHSVTTGHRSGIVTLDLSESDDAHREFVRQQLGEPYRTVLGHLRHEVGHYFWTRLVADHGDLLAEFRLRFGDERQDYRATMEAHYARGPESGDDWSMTHVSRYATMHPWEDWAETFAHYLHISGGLETAEAYGLMVVDPAQAFGASVPTSPYPGAPEPSIGPMIQRWLGLTVALNALSRSIGRDDLYPFTLSPEVVAKLDFVDRVVAGANPGAGVATPGRRS